MAKRDGNHSTGDIAASLTKLSFEKKGYAVNDIFKDYGEDFFVITHDEETSIVEPARIFVQSKGTRTSKWDEYIDPFTVRNWVSSNELVVVIKRSLANDEAKYCIPEFAFSYFDIAAYINEGKYVPIKCTINFNNDSPDHLIWAARIRHYERMALLSIPGNDHFVDIPAVRLYGWEFLGRCGLVNENFVPSEVSIERLSSLNIKEGDLKDEDNFTVRQQVLYNNWVVIINNRLKELSPCVLISKTFIEHLGIVMQLAGFQYGLDKDSFDYTDLEEGLHFLWKP